MTSTAASIPISFIRQPADSSGFSARVALALLLLVPVVAWSQEKHVPTLVETLGTQVIGSPKISPDGHFVAYRVRETNWDTDEFVWRLWLVNVITGGRIQLTRAGKSVEAMEWSPDGRLAFLKDSDAATGMSAPAGTKAIPPGLDNVPSQDTNHVAAKQIWIMAPEGGAPRQITESMTDISSFHWSRNGQSLLFAAPAPSTDRQANRVVRYGEYQVVDKDYDQNQLWSADVSAAIRSGKRAKAVQLTLDPALNVKEFASSPDSHRIAFSATRNPFFSSSVDEDVYMLDLESNKRISKIVSVTGPKSALLFSADGSRLAFTTTLGNRNYFYAISSIAAVNLADVVAKPATTSGDVRVLTAAYDEDPEPVAWNSSGLYFLGSQKMTSRLFRVDPDAQRIEQMTPGDGLIVEDASVTPDGTAFAFIAEDSTHLKELYVSPTAQFLPKKLTDMTAQVEGWKLGSTEVVSWRSKDGTLIEGVLHKPGDFDPKRKYPLLVKIHGGPDGTSLPNLMITDDEYPTEAFLAKGGLVLEPNYRGSAGYGKAFRALNVRNLGIGDMWDVMSGIDSLVKKGFVDENRLGSMGWSQGGYISAYLTTHTDRFKAISVGAGISDWLTYYVNTDATPWTSQYLGATPWKDPSIYAKASAMTTIQHAVTPTLIQHGSEDRRVPVPGAYELYRGLLDQHVDARLILYTGFGHQIDKPKSLLAVRRANLDWFGHYIWQEPIPAESTLLGSSEAANVIDSTSRP